MVMINIKKRNGQNVCRRTKTYFEDFKNCLEANQHEIETNHLEKKT